jgi:hypothetical protein
MKITLSILILLLILVCPVFAAGTVSPPASAIDKEFALQKAERLKKLDEKIALLQARRACIQAANDKGAYKVCNEKYKSAN